MKLKRHKQFLKDWRKINLSDEHFEKFIDYSSKLKSNISLPEEARDHELKGDYNDYREFHLGGDMLIIYKINVQKIEFFRMGTHSQLFK
jgi:mRNA interferase YafQ